MNQRKAHNFYHGINLHFTNKDYSILKYGSNTKLANSKFDSMSLEQKYRFEWLARKFTNTQDLVYACIGAQFDEVNIQYDDKESIVTSYLKLKRRRDALTYTIKNEHSKFNDVPVNKLIFKFFGREVSPEYMLLSTHGTEEIQELYEDVNFSFGRPKLLKLMKYKDFLPVNKYLNIFQETREFA